MAEALVQSGGVRRSGGKSASAFRTISEVSTELDVPTHVLRFWESKFSQVRPLKRGGGRRYYRPEDIDLLRRIRSLLYDDGYTIKGVQKLLREGNRKGGQINSKSVPPSDILETARSGDPFPESKRNQLLELVRELEGLRDSLRVN